jgi:hypothetical protein
MTTYLCDRRRKVTVVEGVVRLEGGNRRPTRGKPPNFS